MIHLKPGNTERHHDVSHRMGLWKKIFDFLAGTNVPVRYAGIDHLLLRTFGQSPALSHSLHDFEGALFRHAAGNQIKHDVITAPDCLVNRCGFGGNQILGIAQPHIRAMGEAGQA